MNQCAQAFTIFTGDNKTLNSKAVYAVTDDPLDLTSCTEIVVNLPNADGSFLQRKLSLSQVSIVGSPLLGKFATPISSIQSALLNPGELQNFDVTFTIASAVFTVRYYGALSVFVSP